MTARGSEEVPSWNRLVHSGLAENGLMGAAHLPGRSTLSDCKAVPNSFCRSYQRLLVYNIPTCTTLQRDTVAVQVLGPQILNTMCLMVLFETMITVVRNSSP